MKERLLAGFCVVVSIGYVALVIWLATLYAPRCSPNSPPGPSIGHVWKLYGC